MEEIKREDVRVVRKGAYASKHYKIKSRHDGVVHVGNADEYGFVWYGRVIYSWLHSKSNKRFATRADAVEDFLKCLNRERGQR
jgi:hypothetical protein